MYLDDDSLETPDHMPLSYRLAAWLSAQEFWHWLVEPVDSIRGADLRRRVRLLSSLLVFLIPQATAGVIWVLLADHSVAPFENTFFYVAVPTLLIFVLAYLLSRTRHYWLGAVLTVVLLPAMVFSAALTVSRGFVSTPELLIWLTLNVLLSSIFFSVSVTSLLTALSLLGMLVLPFVSPAIEPRNVIVPVIYTGILSTLIIVAARHRNLVERDRRRALEESELRYRTLLETVFDGILFHDNETLLDANTGFAEMFGYELQEVIGQPLSRFAVSGTGNRKVAESIAQGEQQVHEVQGVRKDGERFDIEVVGRLQPYHGEIVQMVAVRDISERKRAEKAERNRRILAEAMQDIASALNSTLDLEEVLDRILKNVGRVVPHDAANIMLIEAGIAYVARASGYVRHEGAIDTGRQFNVEDVPFLQRLVESHEPLAIPYTTKYPGWVDVLEEGWSGSYAGAPILSDNRVIGLLNLDSAEAGFFEPGHAEDLKTFADQAAVAIQNARLYKELQFHSQGLEIAVEQRTAELKRVKERVEAILNNSPDATLLLRTDGLVSLANPAVGTILGYGGDEVRLMQLAEFVEEPFAEALNEALATTIEEARIMRLESTARRKDGSTFDADIALGPIRDEGQVLNVVVSFRDISALKEVERMKDAFVSNVSHELRTPITSLRLHLQLLKMNPENLPTFLDRIQREVGRLEGIIEDLLRLSRLEQQRVKLRHTPVNLNMLANQYMLDRTPVAHSKNLDIAIDYGKDMPTVMADEGLMGQVLSILLTNAINYTPAGGRILVRTFAEDVDGVRGAALSVSDTGPGIAPDEREHIFDRFYRGEAGTDSGIPGTGLGLSIAREVIERHGGRIEVSRSDLAETGAQFTVWLPAYVPSDETVVSK
jgi:two-component system phosphate regulon sensor histidine kinase PhoR